jgi:hypothetical protein
MAIIRRAVLERWPISAADRRLMIDRVVAIALGGEPHQSIAAVRLMLEMSKFNMELEKLTWEQERTERLLKWLTETGRFKGDDSAPSTKPG